MIWIFAVFALTFVSCETEVKQINVPSGKEVVNIESPNYPESSPVGTNIQWEFTTEEGSEITIVCEDLRISPTEECEKGYLKVTNEKEGGKYCGSESGLTVTSVTNKVTLEFDLTWASGVVKCSAKSAKKEETNKDVESETTENTNQAIENVHIKVGGRGYDNIYFNPLPRLMTRQWHFTTDANAQLSLFCSEFKISNGARCKDEEMVVTSGNTNRKYCGSEYNLLFRSEGNTMDIKLKTSNERGAVNCLVQAVTGQFQDQYRNVISYEVDSNEYGGKGGQKSTNCACGWANKNMQRVVNGKVAKNNEYPWMVALWEGQTHFCGGSIITANHVLTAAHCTVSKTAGSIEVLVGSNSRILRGKGQVIKVEKIVEHNYDKFNAHIHDIAILVLKTSIEFSQIVGPVCLTPKQPPVENKYITLMGWGYLGKEGNWEHPEMLRTAHMRVVDFPTCNNKYYNRFDRVNESRICTWASNRDSCMGDSGGPLVWLDPETNRYTQLGLVSFGRGCNTNDPKINTAVSTYFNWIQSAVKDTKPGMHVCQKK